MVACAVTPIVTSKACNGKCSGACGKSAGAVIAAACGGYVCLFEKKGETLLELKHPMVFSSMEAVLGALAEKEMNGGIDQLILIGSATDIAWLHALLPADITRHIVAEIEYPLVPAWFKNDRQRLASAIENLMR